MRRLSGNWVCTMTKISGGVSLTLILVGSLADLAGAKTAWAVWLRNQSSPGIVTVAPPGTLRDPWQVDSIWPDGPGDAWKKACWLTRQGDLYGRQYSSPEIDSGRIACDQNCNCRL